MEKGRKNAAIVMSVLALAGMLSAFVLPFCAGTEKFANADLISIGASKQEVIDIIGSQPDEKTDYEYIWYSEDYLKKKEEIENFNSDPSNLEDMFEEMEKEAQALEELENMEHQELIIRFNESGYAISIEYNASAVDADKSSERKSLESGTGEGDLSLKEDASDKVKTQLFADVRFYYTDGSIYKAREVVNVTDIAVSTGNMQFKVSYKVTVPWSGNGDDIEANETNSISNWLNNYKYNVIVVYDDVYASTDKSSWSTEFTEQYVNLLRQYYPSSSHITMWG